MNLNKVTSVLVPSMHIQQIDSGLDVLKSLLIAAVPIVALAALGLIAVQFLKRRAERFIRTSERFHEERQQQLITLLQISQWGASVLIVGAALLMVLSHVTDITPLLTSVGVAGLAVSLGAQTLIKDLIGGIVILVENQYNVGDVIQVGDVSGEVEQFTLRATHLRGLDGKLHIVPNGEVRVVSNITKEWSRAMVEVGVAYEEDLNRVLSVLEEIAEAFAQDPDFGPQLLEPPEVAGPISLGDWAMTVRVMVKTEPGKHWGIARELQKRILLTFEEEDITMPYPRQEVLLRNVGEN